MQKGQLVVVMETRMVAEMMARVEVEAKERRL